MSVRPLLSVKNVSKRFGGLQALSNVGLNVKKGDIYGLIGPNGAGKTTFFNVITGLYTPDEGSFNLNGSAYEPIAVHHVAQAGIARTFQNIRLFGGMSVLDNVMVGHHVKIKKNFFGALLRTPSERKKEKEIREFAMNLLRYVGIENYADYTARNLSYGHQRRLEIARALATGPKLLALDEPAAGMNDTEKVELTALLKKIRDDGYSILLIEHDVKLMMSLCNGITVLDYGKVIAEGPPEKIKGDPKVIEAYLGTGVYA